MRTKYFSPFLPGSQLLWCGGQCKPLRIVAVAILLAPLGLTEQVRAEPQYDPYGNSYPPQQNYPPPANQQIYPQRPYQPPYAQQAYPDDSGQAYPQQNYGQEAPQGQPLDAEQLEQLVAPIALYPDALVAQMLAGATYPAQVVIADHWRQARSNWTADQIAAEADAQTWDPSVKALTAFPQVLAQMDQNLQWTVDLGNAYYNQPQDVLQTVQVMRERAQAAGNLESTAQQTVYQDQGNIEVAPANPQVVYVPAYNPWAVYGQPVSPYPGFSLVGALGAFFGSSPVRFGLGMAMGAFTHTSWGWLGWGLNWLTQSVLFQHSNYASHSTSVAHWGSTRGYPESRAVARGPVNYGRQPQSYGQQRGGNYATSGQGYARPPERYAESRPGQGYLRDNRAQTSAWAQQAYSRLQPPARTEVYRPQQMYGRSGNESAFNARPGPSYSYRARVQSGGYSERSYQGYGGKPKGSGGFHLFGGGHSSESFRGDRAPKGFSSKHSGGGGHFGGHHGGGHHR